jgi:hypothetical protein
VPDRKPVPAAATELPPETGILNDFFAENVDYNL